jgi:hypothetical protein
MVKRPILDRKLSVQVRLEGLMKLKKYTNNENDSYYVIVFYCPACGRCHPYSLGEPKQGRPVWNFNGNWESPTFTPSLRVLHPYGATECHVNITDGYIYYHSDCPHSYANKVVPLQDITEEILEW